MLSFAMNTYSTKQKLPQGEFLFCGRMGYYAFFFFAAAFFLGAAFFAAFFFAAMVFEIYFY
ncbi:MAG: hypothetical protein UY04_C0020G0002 [Parcubacteria group bacterium GW2011_GWA2_47_7]|nr:MAG: hypothetical protein UY04_C0020G0002 [Parcubacteria group bacterium GW2011_GWA2_47_7]